MTEEPGAGGSLVRGFGRFSLSSQAQKIIEIARDERAPAQSFIQVISADRVLAPRLLRLANFTPGLSVRLATLAQATSVFGQDHLKALALALTVLAPSDGEGDAEAVTGDEAQLLRSFWEHALGCAILGGQIAARLKNPAPLHAFTAGFLHDLGRALLYRQDRGKFRKAVSVAADKCIPLREAETLAMGINHAEMGEIWCRNTDLAPVFQRTARAHHDGVALDLGTTTGGEDLQLMAVIQAADSMCEACGMGSGADLAGAPLNAWRGLGLNENEWLDSLQAIKTQIDAAAEDFGFPAPTTSEPLQRTPTLERNCDGISRPQREVANGPRGRGSTVSRSCGRCANRTKDGFPTSLWSPPARRKKTAAKFSTSAPMNTCPSRFISCVCSNGFRMSKNTSCSIFCAQRLAR
jgi:HD-like signal output (HDOD) protein